MYKVITLNYEGSPIETKRFSHLEVAQEYFNKVSNTDNKELSFDLIRQTGKRKELMMSV